MQAFTINLIEKHLATLLHLVLNLFKLFVKCKDSKRLAGQTILKQKAIRVL